MFLTLIYPPSGACDCVDELPHRSSCSQFVVCWSFGAAGFRWCSFCRLKHSGDHGLSRLVEFRFKAPPGTTSSSITTHTQSRQRNRALWASQPQKSVTLLPCPEGRTTKSTKDMWWHGGNHYQTAWVFGVYSLLVSPFCYRLYPGIDLTVWLKLIFNSFILSKLWFLTVSTDYLVICSVSPFIGDVIEPSRKPLLQSPVFAEYNQ